MRVGLDAMKADIGGVPLYPSAIAVAFVLRIWLESSLDIVPLLRPILVATAAGIALTILGVAVMRHRHRGGAIAGIALLGLIGGDDPRVLALTGVAIAGVLILAAREQRFERPIPWYGITRLLNLVTVILVALLVGRAMGTILSLPPAVGVALNRPAATGAPPPDIVVILLDAHGRQDILADQYGEDISAFVAALGSRGFDVSSRSRSNYMSTQLTLASMFNLKHLSRLNLPPQTELAYNAGLRASLDDNRAFAILRAAGYQIGSVPSGYEGVAFRSSDVFLEGGQVSELESVLIANSALRRALDTVAGDALADQVRERVRWNLEPGNWLPGLADVATLESPYFMFVHVPSPHPPYLFDRNGAPIRDRTVVVTGRAIPSEPSAEMISATARAYAEQLAFIDGLTIAAVDLVIAAVPSGAVIIVMADHGPDVHVDWNRLDTTDSRERFATLFAARTPGFERLFGDAPTPVNLFPTFFNAYVGTDLPLEPDSSFLGIPPRHGLVDIGDPDRAVH